MLEQFDITVGNWYVSWKDLTKWSDDALDTEYGEYGSYAVDLPASKFYFALIRVLEKP